MTDRQVAMVIDLNKCIGCQACTAACKSLWTDEPGQEYMLWNNVETKPGPGYPRYWEEGDGGWTEDGTALKPGVLPAKEDHGEEIPLNFEEVYFDGTADRLQRRGADRQEAIAAELRLIAEDCAWVEEDGNWAPGVPWNAFQATPSDIKKLGSHLVSTYYKRREGSS